MRGAWHRRRTRVRCCGRGVHPVSGWRWLVALGFAVVGVTVLYLLRFALAVPAAALEDLGAWRALGRAWKMARGRSASVVGSVVLPLGGAALASVLLRKLIGAVVPIPWQPFADGAATTLTGWLALLIAVCSVTGSYLSRVTGDLVWDGVAIPSAQEAVRENLPATPPPRRRPAVVIAAGVALLMPAALYAGYPLTGLRPIPQVSDQAIAAAGTPDFAMTLTRTGGPSSPMAAS